jgi:hypothetical protein
MVFIMITGCSATGPKYSVHQSTAPSLAEGSSRVFFFRNTRFMSGGADAEIYINNNKVGECADSAYFYTDVKSRTAEIKAENTGTLGTHMIKKNLEKDNEYYFELLVNEAYIHSGVFLGVIGQGIYVGNNDNVSGWIFKEVAKQEAIPQLQDKVFSLDGE